MEDVTYVFQTTDFPMQPDADNNNLRAIRYSVVRLIGACDGQRGDQAQDGDWQI